ncbi:CAP domain-containing protein [Heyndrickxia sp. NPDC080065]|uniref:CAP domain-containing protein n=1 Tax=Heyndrickxia sp. NPDC080065 TaxID=3390568 RepID=UPI003CFCF011
MRTLIKVFVVLVIIFIISLYFHLRPDNENNILNGNNKKETPMVDNLNGPPPKEIKKYIKRPKQGLSTFIGESSEKLIKKYGVPSRKDPSAYDYEWWIYNNSDESYFQVGVYKGKVVTIYAIGSKNNIVPFTIDEEVQNIYQSIPLDPDITVQYDEGTYRFELSEEDLNIRPLVQLGSIYAQLSFDKFKGTLSSVRFMDKETLIKQRPYEMVYRGRLIDPSPIVKSSWRPIEIGSEKQIFDLTNIIRQRFGLNKLEWDQKTADVAYRHSKDMFAEKYFSHESPKYGDLEKRLKSAHVFYQLAGENIAAQYIDGPTAVEGWLNSDGHRKSLLESNFTHIGVGVFQKYYTQNFIEKNWE